MAAADDLPAAINFRMNKPLAHFFANITKTVSASGIQFLITLCSTPIMTRLYEPAAYATFGIVNTTATVLIGIGLLSLPNAYCAERSADVRAQIIQTMLVLLTGLVLLASMIAATVASFGLRHNGISIPALSLVLLPLLVLTYGARQIVVNMAIQRANFTRLSLSQVIEPVCSRGGSIALGAAAGGNPAFILGSVALGHISTMLILLRMVPRNIHGHWQASVAQLPYLVTHLRRYGDFVVFGTMSQQAQQVVMLGMQLSIAAFFSSELAGQYILASSILTLPVTLIALSTAPVVYHHFIEIERNDPAHLPRHFLMATGFYLLGGICILLPVRFFGEEIFRIAFGTVWLHAGGIASMLSIAYVGTFTLTGVQSIFMVTRRLKLQFLLEVGTCIPVLLLAIYCFKAMNFDRAIFYLSLIWLLRNIVLLLAALTAAFQHPPQPGAAVHD